MDKLFKLQPVISYLAVPNFKQAYDTMVVQEEILINILLDFIDSNFGLLKIIQVTSLNQWMSFEVDLNVRQRLILLLDFLFARKVKDYNDFSNEVQIWMVLISVIREVDYVTDFEILVVLICFIFLLIDGTLLSASVFIMQKVDIRDLNFDLFLHLICDFLEELANNNFFDLYSWWQVINNIFEVHVEYASDISFGYSQLFVTSLFRYNRFRSGTFNLRG